MKRLFYLLSIVMLCILIFTNLIELINSGAIVRAIENVRDLVAI